MSKKVIVMRRDYEDEDLRPGERHVLDAAEADRLLDEGKAKLCADQSEAESLVARAVSKATPKRSRKKPAPTSQEAGD